MENVILMATDDRDRSRALAGTLGEAGYSVKHARNYSEVIALMEQDRPDLLLVDSRLPGMIRFNLVERLSGNGVYIPVMVLGDDRFEEAISALEAGAHDYVPNDRDTRELLARIANLLRLFQADRSDPDERIRIGDLVIDPLKRSVTRGEAAVELTHREFELLWFLAKRAGRVCTREDILRHVWDFDFHTGTNVVDVYILHLREKIDKGRKCKLLRTIRGTGYRLLSPEEADEDAKDRLP